MLLLAIGFPLTAHFAAVGHNASLTLASVGMLAALVMLPKLMQWRVAAWCAVPAVLVGLFVLWRVHAEWLPLYAMPVFINFFVAWLFGHTLAPGETPLVERLVRLLHESADVTPHILRYARRVTVAWTVLMSALGLLSLTLALVARPNGILELLGLTPPFSVSLETWSLCANGLNYLIPGVFFVAEYLYRDSRFPEHPYRNLLDFMRRAAAVGPQALRLRQP